MTDDFDSGMGIPDDELGGGSAEPDTGDSAAPGHEGEVARLRAVEALETADADGGIALQDTVDEPGQLLEGAGLAHRRRTPPAGTYFFSLAFSWS